MTLRAISGFSTALLMVAVLSAQAPSGPQDPPTFRSGVDLIEVDVVVTDRQGNPVRDLTRDDFEIVEDGRSQTVRTFSLVDLPIPPPAPTPQRGRVDLEPDTASNAAPEGRTYVMLLDSESTIAPPMKQEIVLRTKQIARQFLTEAVRAGDQVAVIHAQGSNSDGQGFTSSRALVDRAIDRFGRGLSGPIDWQARPGDPSVEIERVRRTLVTYRTLQDVAERLGSVGGRRKVIVWIGGQIDTQPERHMASDSNSPIAASAGILHAALRDALQAAARNNVAVYPVDPVGLTPAMGQNELIRMSSLRSIAEDTGGIATVNSNNYADAYAAIVRDASTYYLLGYSPDRDHPRDGSFHPIKVRVKRPDVTVRARPGYFTGSVNAPSSGPLPAPPEGVSLAARDALRRPLLTHGLGIDVTATTFKGTADNTSVVVTAHVRGQTLDFEAGQRLAISYQVFDVDGKVATGFYKVFGFNLGSDNRQRATGKGLQFVERITLKPGRYELRLVAEQPGGPIGSVVTHVEAEKFDGVLELSGVALAPRRTSEVLLVSDKTLRSGLSVDPTARRGFRAADGLSAYSEVYTDIRDEYLVPRLSSVRVASVTATLTTAAGGFVARAQGERVLSEPDGRNAREGFRMDFDLARVSPGPHVLTIEARSSQTGTRTVRRQIPFTVE
jgi:VWFA-related protein